MKVKHYPVTEIISIQDMVLKNTSIFSGSLALADLNNTPLGRVTYAELLDNIFKYKPLPKDNKEI